MKCSNCGCDNSNNAKFCKDCGKELENKNINQKTLDKNVIIIIGLLMIVVVLFIGVLFVGGMIKTEVPLETMDFEIFKIDVPVGSEFVETNLIPNYGFGGLIKFENNGDYSKEVFSLIISNGQGSSAPSETIFDRAEGDIKVYKDAQGVDSYFIMR